MPTEHRDFAACSGTIARSPSSAVNAISTSSAVQVQDRAPIAVWLQASRVQSLLISTISVAAGAAVARWHGYASPAIMLAWIAAVAAQAGTNLTNVSFNYKAGDAGTPCALADPRGSSSPLRTGQLTQAQVRRGAMVCFAASILAGAVLAAWLDVRLLVLGIPGLLAGYFYAAPPARLAYRGLGVVTVLVFMGPAMVVGSYWVSARAVSSGAWAAALAVGLTAAAVMHVNDVRDFESDVAHGKTTLTTLVGREGASWLMAAMLAGAYGSVVAAVSLGALPAATLATLLSAPMAFRLARIVATERGVRPLNEAWFIGVKLHTVFGALLIGALLAAALAGR